MTDSDTHLEPGASSSQGPGTKSLPNPDAESSPTAVASSISISARGSKPGRPLGHWADLDLDQRKDAVAGLGLPKFRADQISRRYFGQLSNDPQTWSELSDTTAAQVADISPE